MPNQIRTANMDAIVIDKILERKTIIRSTQRQSILGEGAMGHLVAQLRTISESAILTDQGGNTKGGILEILMWPLWLIWPYPKGESSKS